MGKFILAIIGILAVIVSGIIIAKTGTLSLAIIPFILAAIVVGFLILQNPFFGFLLIIFFLPFERVPTLEFGGINIKINTVLGFLTLFSWVLSLIFNGKKRSPAGEAGKIQPNFLFLPLMFFILGLGVSLTQANNLDRALQVFIFTLFTIALSVLAVNMIPDISNLKKTILVLLTSGLVVGIFGLFQFGGDVIGLPRSITLLKTGYTSQIFGFPRIQAFSMEPLYFANYLLIPLSLALAYFFGKVNIFQKEERNGSRSFWLLIVLLVLLLINFVLTVSRGGYFGFAATLLVFIIFYFKKLFTWRNLAIVIVIGLVYWGVSFALSQSKGRALSQFIGHATLQDISRGESIQGRLMTFNKAIDVFKKNMTLGIGLGNYGPWVKGYPLQPPPTGWDIVNNQYIELGVETGLVGLITFGLLLFVLIMRSLLALRVANEPFLRATLIGLLAAFIGVLVQFNFFSTLYIIHIWILIGLLVAVQNLVFKNSKLKTQMSK